MEPHLHQLKQAPLLKRALQRRLAETTGVAIGGKRSSPIRQDETLRQRRGVQPTPCKVLLQALLHSRSRIEAMPEALALPNYPEAQALRSLLAVMREHPEYAGARDLVEHFRGHPEQAAIEAAAAGLLKWDTDYDVEADFQGALATLAEQAAKVEAEVISRKNLSDISPEERTRYMAALKNKKLDRLKPVEREQ
jgi:hypothetical protein